MTLAASAKIIDNVIKDHGVLHRSAVVIGERDAFDVVVEEDQNGYSVVLINRHKDGVSGYILNTTPYVMEMTYVLKTTGDCVGPTSDVILPGQFREIGCGPGVEWQMRPNRKGAFVILHQEWAE